jgi:deoxyribonuclease-4
MSVAGGVYKAFDHLEAVRGKSLQIFTKNQRQWKAKPLDAEVAARFVSRWAECGKVPMASHGSYLVNLATGDPELGDKSIANLVDELQRCHALGIGLLVIHPGAHGGDGVAVGIERVAKRLDIVLEKAGVDSVEILIETTAGAGTGLGAKFQELADIISASATPERLGICLDTCHVHAAGYDFTSEEGYQKTFIELDQTVGIKRLKWFHLNDSLTPCGSHRDRHTHIGEGSIGLDGFRLLVNDPRFASHPMALETPKGDDLEDDRRNLATLQKLVAG